MTNETDTFDWEGDAAGGSVSADREERTFSPAAGESETADAGRDHVDASTTREDASGDEVALKPGAGIRGSVVDPETGLRFVRGRSTMVAPEHVERLLESRRRGAPVLVRADS